MKTGIVWQLKYGFNGLVVVVYSATMKNEKIEKSRILDKIVLSRDPKEMLTFLGFDYERWLKGFDTMEDIFDYVIDSKYFNPKWFQWDELSSLHKNRNKRRPMYWDFLKYMKTKGVRQYYERTDDRNFDMIDKSFPGFLEKIEHLKELDRKNQIAKSKFNGNLVKEYYGLEGKELGQSIINFKSSFKDKEYMNWWLYTRKDSLIWKMFDASNLYIDVSDKGNRKKLLEEWRSEERNKLK